VGPRGAAPAVGAYTEWTARSVLASRRGPTSGPGIESGRARG